MCSHWQAVRSVHGRFKVFDHYQFFYSRAGFPFSILHTTHELGQGGRQLCISRYISSPIQDAMMCLCVMKASILMCSICKFINWLMMDKNTSNFYLGSYSLSSLRCRCDESDASLGSVRFSKTPKCKDGRDI